jgi:hypothetical protein
MTGLPFDLQKEAADYITVMKDLGYVSQEQYDKLPENYRSRPPVPGAKLAPDGKWYVPDPKRKGKYLRVD